MWFGAWALGWLIQFLVASLAWLPLILLSGWEGSWARAWALGANVRNGFWLTVGAALALALLLSVFGTSLRAIPGVSDILPGIGATRTASVSGTHPDPDARDRVPPTEGPVIVDVDGWSSATVNVYDYTTTDPWTALVISTVAEFNAARPPTAPRLVYVTEPGDAECLDITNTAVWKLTGIVVCDTKRPEDFPDDPNAPVKGWGGFTEQIDDDTTKIVLNNFVPDGYYRPVEVADNTVCHEMMHAYLGVDDNYDSDVNSCVFGELLSPGSTDVRLMKERWPVKGGVLIPGESIIPIELTPTPQRPTGAEGPAVPARAGCDPAYPDARTCIPPGPPFNQGCAITNERNFTALPPDPQGLDSDKDGMGCEPISP